VNTRRSDSAAPGAWPGTSGRLVRAQAINATAITVITPKHNRQPTILPSRVPAGTPSDNASGVPTMAIAIAWPRRCGGAMRAA
jgi:hypothetical protein